MTKKTYKEVLFISIIPFVLMSCDAFYVTRGVVTEVIEDQYTRKSSTNHLKDVEINTYYIGKEGNIGSLVNEHLFTDQDGKYRINFAGPPGGLDRSVFFKFTKPGYANKKVFIDDNNKDADVTIKRCPEKTKYQGCWTIDVILTRVGK